MPALCPALPPSLRLLLPLLLPLPSPPLLLLHPRPTPHCKPLWPPCRIASVSWASRWPTSPPLSFASAICACSTSSASPHRCVPRLMLLPSLPSFRFQGPAETLWRSAQNHRWSPHPRMARLLPLQKPPALLLSRHDRTRDHRSPGADGCHDHRSAHHPLSCSAFEDASPPHAFSQVPL